MDITRLGEEFTVVYDRLDFDGHESIHHFFNRKNGWKAIIAIHNTTLGPAMGGCRMYPYAYEDDMFFDVLRLSRGMTYKAALAGKKGLPWGGGKMVVWGDPKTDKTQDLLHWVGDCVQSLGGRYFTGEDMGITPADVDIMKERTAYALGGSEGSGDPSLMTARGVRFSILKSIKLNFASLPFKEIEIAIMGVGAVGAYLADLLYKDGFKLHIADAVPGRAEAIAERHPGVTVVDWHEIHALPVHVFAPCAIGGILDTKRLPELKCKIVCGCANNQLANDQIDELLYKRGIRYAPDFVVNAGGLCNIIGEKDPDGYCENKVMQYIYQIPRTLGKIFEISARDKKPTGSVALALAKQRLKEAEDTAKS